MTDQTTTADSSIDGRASALTVRLEDAWSRSLVEEVISVLWAIAAILCFGFGFNVAGWCFAIKAILDTGTSIFFAVAELIRERKDASSNAEITGG
jgi:hypothetical protein